MATENSVLTILDLHSSIVLTFSIAAFMVCSWCRTMRPWKGVPVSHVHLIIWKKYPIFLKCIWQIAPKFRKHCIPISLKLIQVSHIPLDIYQKYPISLKVFGHYPYIPKSPSRASTMSFKRVKDMQIHTRVSGFLRPYLYTLLLTRNIFKKDIRRSERWVTWEIRGTWSLFNIVSEYDQEILQSQTADKPMAPRGRATQQSWGTWRQTNQSNLLFRPHQDECKPEWTQSNAQQNTKQLQNPTTGATYFRCLLRLV